MVIFGWGVWADLCLISHQWRRHDLVRLGSLSPASVKIIRNSKMTRNYADIRVATSELYSS